MAQFLVRKSAVVNFLHLSIIVSEAFPWGGVAAEVVARVTAEGFGLLDAPSHRLSSKDTPVPYHPSLWGTHRPTASSITDALHRLLKL